MIEKLQKKYAISGAAKKFLNLLGSSVYTDNLDQEIKFTKNLPINMQNCIVDSIHSV